MTINIGKLSIIISISSLVAILLAKINSDSTPITGGTLNIMSSELQINHIDPQRIYIGRDLAFFGNFITRTLTTYAYLPGNEGVKLVPDMATDTGVTTDGGKTWTFTLKPNITWEDGTPVTVEDIKYGISRTFATDVITDGPTYIIGMLDISTYKGPYKANASNQALFDKAVICKNNTITFKLNKKVVDFNEMVTLLAFSPVRKSKDTKDKYDKMIESTGPYKIDKYDTTSLKLVRNTKWNKSSDLIRKAYPDIIEVKFNQNKDYQQEIVDIFNGLVKSTDPTFANAISFNSFSQSDVIDIVNILADSQYKNRIINDYDSYTRYYAINIKKINSLKLRQAIYLALDRESLLKNNYGDNYELFANYADGFISPLVGLDYAPNILLPDLKNTGNPEVAKLLLEQVKTDNFKLYKRATTTGLILDLGDSEINRKIGSIWIKSLAKCGIKIIPNYIEPGKYYSIVLNPDKQGDISTADWSADWSNALTVIPELFTTEGGFNLSQNNDASAYPEFKKIVNLAKSETNRTKQSDLWKQLNQYAVDQVWAIPLSFNKYFNIHGTKIGGAYNWKPYSTYNFNSLYIKK